MLEMVGWSSGSGRQHVRHRRCCDQGGSVRSLNGGRCRIHGGGRRMGLHQQTEALKGSDHVGLGRS
jgi:hypothetical protein